jgi:hypothetical protein
MDNPGSQDSRGISQQIINNYVKYSVGGDIKKMQFLIVAAYNSLTEDRGTYLINYFN